MVDVNPWTPGPWELIGISTGWYVEPLPQGYDGEFENEADARLIALSPEMAELLQDVVRTFWMLNSRMPTAITLQQVVDVAERAADLLSRARGET